ncbi:MAG: hypothetical protein U5J98_03980 [Halobacteriales archaeon]|nr:hypothetical protein [Halobacteriales archaeon]
MSSDIWTEDDPAQGALARPDREGGLAATVVRYDDMPDECTIHPVNAVEEDLMTRWITATGDAYVSLPDSR